MEQNNVKLTNIQKMNLSLFKINDDDQIKDRVKTLFENQLVDYKNHIFRLHRGKQLEEFQSSIKEAGIINPVIVRKLNERFYEILSGHNRVHAARAVGIQEIPVVIKEDLSEDQALEIVLATNLNQRSMNDLRPSERAAVITQYYELLKRTGKRNALIKEVDDMKFETTATGGVIETGEKFEMSGMQVSRYVRINSLVEGIKALIDEGKISIKVGVVLSELSCSTQELIAPFINKNKIDLNQAKALAEQESLAPIDLDYLMLFFGECTSKKVTESVSLKKSDYKKFFDESVNHADIGKKIVRILDEYVKLNGIIR